MSAAILRVSKRSLVFVLIVTAAVVLLGCSQTWVTATAQTDSPSVEEVTVAGAQTHPVLLPVAIALLVCSIVLALTRRFGTYLVAGFALLLACGTGYVTLFALQTPLAGVSKKLTELTGLSGGAELAAVTAHTTTVWPIVTVAAATGAALTALLVLINAAGWHSSAEVKSRYDKPGEFTGQNSAQTASGDNTEAVDDRVSDWDRLSAGEDPTA